LGTFPECFARTHTFCLGNAIHLKVVVCECVEHQKKSNDGRYALVVLCTFFYNSLHNSVTYTWFSIVGILFMPHF